MIFTTKYKYSEFMKLDLIYTKRKYEHRFFFDLVYEWEDILIKALGLKPYHYDEEWSRWGGIMY